MARHLHPEHHLALNPETRGVIGASVFDAMREGAYFINTARCEVVDQAASCTPCARRACAPGSTFTPPNPLLPRASSRTRSRGGEFVRTHHIGLRPTRRGGHPRETVRIVRTFKETARSQRRQHSRGARPRTHVLVVDTATARAPGLRARRRPRRRDQRAGDGNIVFEGSDAAVARINLEGAPSAPRRKNDGRQRRHHRARPA